jgi:putative DNA primase/helicase
LQHEQAGSPGSGIPDGSRNNTLFAYACSLRAKNVDRDPAWQAFVARNSECQPPLGEQELKQIFDSAWKYPPGFPLTDLGNAERMVAHHGEDWKWLPELGWCQFQNGLWVPDASRAVMRVAGEVAREMYVEAAGIEDEVRRRAVSSWAVKTESKKLLDAMVSLAATRPEVADSLKNFDADNMMLACRNGVVDLRTGKFREATREDRLMKVVNCYFDPKAVCPKWETFLNETFKGHEATIPFMQRAIGYCLTGLIVEQVIFILQGGGGDGKTTLMNVVRCLLGEYATPIQAESLTARRSGGIPNDVAAMYGNRLVIGSESDKGAHLSEAFVKLITGGDAVTARFLHKEFFKFVPTFKLWLLTNPKPKITGSDYGIWRRIVLVEFRNTVSADKRDKYLDQKLFAEEASGILNWALAGCRDWQKHGLAQPEEIVAGVKQYRNDEDRVTAFLKECMRHTEGNHVNKMRVFKTYEDWCGQQDDEPLPRKEFYTKLIDEKGFKVALRDGYESFIGVSLIDTGGM